MGIYYQVYSPEELSSTEENAIKKLSQDFAKLLTFWPQIGYTVKSFYYVVNERFRGVGPAVYKHLGELQQQNPNISFGIMAAKDLQRVFEQL